MSEVLGSVLCTATIIGVCCVVTGISQVCSVLASLVYRQGVDGPRHDINMGWGMGSSCTVVVESSL